MKRILLTGFEPFGDQTINPSQLLVEQLAKDTSAEVRPQILTVQFDKAFAELSSTVKAQGPFDVILMLGQAGGREKICLERYAHNWMENRIADLKNPAIPAREISDKAPTALMTSLPLESYRDKLNQTFSDRPVTVSLSAGQYVCNHLYFDVLRNLTGLGCKALFVHVPFLPEQISSATIPSMNFKQQLAVLKELLKLLQDPS